MPRPNPSSSVEIARFMGQFGTTEEQARLTLSFMQASYDVGRQEGRAEAQRFFRLALGVEVPSRDEAAMWNNPVPLKNDGEMNDGEA